MSTRNMDVTGYGARRPDFQGAEALRPQGDIGSGGGTLSEGGGAGRAEERARSRRARSPRSSMGRRTPGRAKSRPSSMGARVRAGRIEVSPSSMGGERRESEISRPKRKGVRAPGDGDGGPAAGSVQSPRLAREARCRDRASRRGYPTGGGTPPFGKMVM